MNWATQVEQWKAQQVERGAAVFVVTGHRGYAAYPGSGPANETCRTCRFYERVSTGGRNVYRKCGLMRAVRTGGPGTDIKASSPACEKWQKPEAKK